jgi:hypothetical protein
MPALPPLLGFFGRHPAFRRVVATILGAMMATGCMTWTRAPDRPETLLARQPELAVRVTKHGGQRIELSHPFIAGDSIGGTTWNVQYGLRVMIPLKDVESVEVQRVSAGRTVLLLAAVGVTAAVVVGATPAPQPPPPPPPPSGGYGGGGGGMGLGSCPYVYSWDGVRWRLDSGTFGGAIARALQRTDVDNLDYAEPQDGFLRLRVSNELPETDHVDALAVLAVDHDRDVIVAPDPAGNLHTIGALAAPVSARDFRGADALPRVRDLDGWNWESSLAGRDTARAADLRDGLELAFVRPHGARRAHLVLDGNNSLWSTHLLNEFVRLHGAATQAWYDSLDAQPALAQAIGLRFAQEAFLAASVRTPSGWTRQGTFGGVGPEAVKRQVLELDLSRVVGDTVLVRLESAPAFWLVDRIALDFTADRQLSVQELPLVSARDRAGRDVAPLLAAADGTDYVLHTGDAAELSFRVPALPAGQARTFILHSTGWYKVDTPNTGAPDVATLDAVAHDPFGIARGSVARLNAALARFSEQSR